MTSPRKPRHARGFLYVGGKRGASTKSEGRPGAFFLHRASIGLVKRVQAAAFFSELQIDHFVMAITSFEARVRHTTPHQTA
jgi:hypothetical protein